MRNSILVIILLGLLTSCGSQQSQKKNSGQKTYEVKTQPVHNRLYFSGTIQPLQESALTTPLSAVVQTMHYHYGQQVKKGDIILTLISSELEKQYDATLTDYLKAKDSYAIAQAKFTGTQDLWNAGLLAKNTFLSEQSGLASSRVALMQATRKLKEMMENIDHEGVDKLSTLNIAEFEKVRQALAGHHNSINLKAPSDGVLLYPPKTSESQGKLTVGTTLKAGQVVALVGDLTGIRIEIDIPEVDIDKIHSGMLAKVTGIALGKQVLKGTLVAVNAQASSTNGSALPTFSAVVEVKLLNEIQRSWIKVGMSSSIEIAVDSEEQLLIPIAALKLEKGKSIVNLQEKDGSLKQRIVTTGAAQTDKVVIASGLKPGDVVAYD
ncbi:MAG: efflux RND transporter periplasmic adaptor subunit [Tatlockia sp.]|nr:efflux RND transporter periplasmic adaptor subunit [Tatlockia sp.]